MFSFFKNRKRIAELERQVRWLQESRKDWMRLADSYADEARSREEELAKFKRERGPDGKFRRREGC